jgi:hypothetical protein
MAFNLLCVRVREREREREKERKIVREREREREGERERERETERKIVRERERERESEHALVHDRVGLGTAITTGSDWKLISFAPTPACSLARSVVVGQRHHKRWRLV